MKRNLVNDLWDFIEQMARMDTPTDGVEEDSEEASDIIADLSDDRLCSDADALYNMIGRAREIVATYATAREIGEAETATPATPARPRVVMVCAECGGTDVKSDAYAEWDEDAQEWAVSQTFDKGAYCDDCDGECRIEERPTTTAEELAKAEG